MTADIAQISARSTYFTQSLDKSTFLYMYKTGIPITTDIPTAMVKIPASTIKIPTKVNSQRIRIVTKIHKNPFNVRRLELISC